MLRAKRLSSLSCTKTFIKWKRTFLKRYTTTCRCQTAWNSYTASCNLLVFLTSSDLGWKSSPSTYVNWRSLMTPTWNTAIYYRRFGSRPVLTYPASTYMESCSNTLQWLLWTVWPSILHPWSSWHILSGSGSPRTRNQKEVPESRTGECIRAKTTSLLPMDPSHPRPGVEWQRTELSLSINFQWLNISERIPMNQSYFILEFSQAVATCSIQYNKPCFYNSFGVAFLIVFTSIKCRV